MSTAQPNFVPSADPKDVGGVPPERPEGASIDTPRFMTVSWPDDPEMTRLGGKSIWGFLANGLRYTGPQTPRTGKIGVHSYWSQRPSCVLF